MSKNFFKMALVGLAAAFCLSGQAAPSKNDQEVAMAKCSKDSPRNNGGDCNTGKCRSNGTNKSDSNTGKCTKKTNCNTKKDATCSGPNSCDGTGSKTSSTDSSMKNKRRSAAQKVVNGS